MISPEVLAVGRCLSVTLPCSIFKICEEWDYRVDHRLEGKSMAQIEWRTSCEQLALEIDHERAETELEACDQGAA
jgi:hypothetical protein